MQDVMVPIGDIPRAAPMEARRIPVEWNATALPYDRTETIWGLIDAHTQAHPTRTAIIDAGTEIDYARLTARANAIAGALAARGVAPGSLVGVCMGRTWELVATLVGVLRAGCAYVPLDPAYPHERVRYMLEHARAAVAIVDDDTRAALCDGVPMRLRLDEVGDCTSTPLGGPSAGDLAYVIYTSGSTGQPKGVAVEHRNVVAMVQSMRGLLDDEDLSGVLAAASVCFDPSVMEILGTLCLGGTVVLADNVLALLDMPAANRVRTVIMVPSAMQALLASGWRPHAIRCAVLGGEVLKRPLVAQLHALQPPPRVVNVYGPTENTVYSTAIEIPPGAGAITIGRPVANVRSYLLDASMQTVPVGIPGELYLAGDQLARGYLHDDERTREQFVKIAPSGPIPETRLYRTGDVCQWRSDGEIEFLGRVDQQVKLRGFRIELEEIESTLESMDGVDGAAAAVVDTGGGKKTLVGYVVSRDAAVTGEAARAHVAKRLPHYMVPQLVMQLPALPVLPNGKLDRSRLPEPGMSRAPDRDEEALRCAGAARVAAGAGLEQRLAGLSRSGRMAALLSIVTGEVAQVLGIGDPGQVSPDLAFEALGLDSLDSVELSHRLATVVGRKLPASLAYEHPTAMAVADYLHGLLERDGEGPASTEPASTGRVRGDAADPLARLQSQVQSGHPPFLAAKAPAWSVTDKGMLIREFKRLLGAQRRDPYSKLVRTGSAHKGTVADAHTGEERDAIVWTTNLYLGLNRDRHVIDEARAALERFGTGMGTSATASGLTDAHVAFETAFAGLVGKPAACLFPTGFTANLGAIAGLVGERDVIVMDQLCHASIVDGARLSGATIRTFRHNSASDLASILAAEASPYRTTLVVVEGVYSMGEGTAPLREIVRTAKQHGAIVLVDEAHSFGFYGPRGAGLCAEQGVTGQVDFIMTTLSKALGSLGGVVAANEEHIALLKSSSRAYIYQATSTPADIAAALAALGRLSTDDALRERLWDTTHYMRTRFSDAGYALGTGDGPIVTPHFPDSEKLYALARGLYARGIHTSAVSYPIVERGRGRLRFICSASHSREDVDRTLEALIDAEREFDAQRRGAGDPASGDGGLHAGAAAATGDRPCAPTRPARGGPDDARPGRARVEAWATAFCAHLRQALARVAGPAPSLAVSIGLSDDRPPITIHVNDREVSWDGAEASQVPCCSLRLAGPRSLSALCTTDVQALLDEVITGGCALNGQTEPFVWFIARVADWQSMQAT